MQRRTEADGAPAQRNADKIHPPLLVFLFAAHTQNLTISY